MSLQSKKLLAIGLIALIWNYDITLQAEQKILTHRTLFSKKKSDNRSHKHRRNLTRSHLLHYEHLSQYCPFLLPKSSRLPLTLKLLRRLVAQCETLPRGSTSLPTPSASPTIPNPKPTKNFIIPAINTPIQAIPVPTERPITEITPTSSIPTPPPPFPLSGVWEQNMVASGRLICDRLRGSLLTADERLSSVYYDGLSVFLQIADYTKDSYWLECANIAKSIYRDAYVVPAEGVVPGYWNFTDGLTNDFLQRGDIASRDAVFLLAERAAFASNSTPLSWTQSVELSREVAYTIKTYLNAERLGAPRRARLPVLVDQALSHIDQWFVQRNAPYIRPFMVGLTAHALIRYWAVTKDPRILPALKIAADGLWESMWVENSGAFKYTNKSTPSGGEEPTPDLNMLVAPLYSWLYAITKEERFLVRTDKIMTGSIQKGWLANGKQFNQSYVLAFEVQNLRNGQLPQ